MCAQSAVEDHYPFDLLAGEPVQIDTRPLIAAILKELQNAQPRELISARFHNTVAEMIVEVCQKIRESGSLARVCLSGGTFQNMLLLKRTVAGLRAKGFEVFLHSLVPPNDGGISLGQAVVASERLRQD